ASATSAVTSTAETLASPCRPNRKGAVPDINHEASEIGRDRLRYGQGGCPRKEGVRIIGADQLSERAFRRARQLRNARGPNLAHTRLTVPEALDGMPGRREGTGVLNVNVRLQHFALLDQAEALDHVKLLGVRRPESVHPRPLIYADRIDDERIPFVMA